MSQLPWSQSPYRVFIFPTLVGYLGLDPKLVFLHSTEITMLCCSRRFLGYLGPFLSSISATGCPDCLPRPSHKKDSRSGFPNGSARSRRVPQNNSSQKLQFISSSTKCWQSWPSNQTGLLQTAILAWSTLCNFASLFSDSFHFSSRVLLRLVVALGVTMILIIPSWVTVDAK